MLNFSIYPVKKPAIAINVNEIGIKTVSAMLICPYDEELNGLSAVNNPNTNRGNKKKAYVATPSLLICLNVTRIKRIAKTADKEP